MDKFIVKAKSFIPGSSELQLVPHETALGARKEAAPARSEAARDAGSGASGGRAGGAGAGAGAPKGVDAAVPLSADERALSEERHRRLAEIGERIQLAASPEDAIADPDRKYATCSWRTASRCMW